jgi:trigger factor
MLKSLERDLKQQNLDFDTYLKLMKTDKEKYIEENVRPAAINRVKSSLIIDQVGQDEKIEVAKEDIEGIVSDTVQMLQNMPNQKGKKGKLDNEMVNNVTYNAISRLYNQRTLERMKALANGEIVEVEPEDLAEAIVEKAEEVVESEQPVETIADEVVESEQPMEAKAEDATEIVVEPDLEVESKESAQQVDSEGEETPKE